MTAALKIIPDKTVAWTDALYLAVSRGPAGLAGAVRRIEFVVGPFAGRRGVFQYLLTRDPLAPLTRAERFRVWLLVASIGDNPKAWGIGSDAVPPAFDSRYVRAELKRLCAAGDSNPEPAGLTFVISRAMIPA